MHAELIPFHFRIIRRQILKLLFFRSIRFWFQSCEPHPVPESPIYSASPCISHIPNLASSTELWFVCTKQQSFPKTFPPKLGYVALVVIHLKMYCLGIQRLGVLKASIWGLASPLSRLQQLEALCWWGVVVMWSWVKSLLFFRAVCLPRVIFLIYS